LASQWKSRPSCGIRLVSQRVSGGAKRWHFMAGPNRTLGMRGNWTSLKATLWGNGWEGLQHRDREALTIISLELADIAEDRAHGERTSTRCASPESEDGITPRHPPTTRGEKHNKVEAR
jgi:hypothetical protein